MTQNRLSTCYICAFSRPVSALLQIRPLDMVTDPTKIFWLIVGYKDALAINNLFGEPISQKSYHLNNITWGSEKGTHTVYFTTSLNIINQKPYELVFII